MPEMIEKKCQNCNKLISVRMVDHKRGWGKFCSKSCKAKRQERINGQHTAFLHGRGVSNLHPERLVDYMTDEEYYNATLHPFDPEALGQD